MAVYIYERIDIIGSGRGKFVETIRSQWAPYAEIKHGVRLAGLWATAGSTANWPEADLLWEMDDWEHFARAQAEQFPMEDKSSNLTEMWRQSLKWRSGGESMLLVPSSFTPTMADIKASGTSSNVFLYEEVRTKPGGMDAYHAAVESEYMSIAEARGMRIMGAYRHALRPNVGINIWMLRDWDHCTELMTSEDTHPGAQQWQRRCVELLEDSVSWLLATPPEGRLGT